MHTKFKKHCSTTATRLYHKEIHLKTKDKIEWLKNAIYLKGGREVGTETKNKKDKWKINTKTGDLNPTILKLPQI